MDAIQFNFTIPRYVIGMIASKIYPPLLWNGLSCTSFRQIPEPGLPSQEWVKIRTRMAGICGTDTGTIMLKTSPYFVPFSSFPLTLGHENVGIISEVGAQVEGWQVGDRVIAEPTLWCAPRGFREEEWCEFCQKGETNRCANTTRSALAPGWGIGGCRDTGGSWSPVFTAHQSQLYRIPETISDENAILVEPFACGLHAALQNMPADDQTVLILGAGSMGLMQLAGLRAAGSQARILITARYPFQVDAAQRLGADAVLTGGDLYQQIADESGGSLYTPPVGKRVLAGGVDVTFDCVGQDSTVNDALRLTKAGGRVVVVGMPGLTFGVDWAPIFDNELTVIASYTYSHANVWQGQTRSTFAIALELMEKNGLDLSWMITHRYPLTDFNRALRENFNKRKHPVIKAVFEF